MISDEDIKTVIAAIDDADENSEDDELQAMRAALRFALGYEGTVAEFIAAYIEEL